MAGGENSLTASNVNMRTRECKKEKSRPLDEKNLWSIRILIFLVSARDEMQLHSQGGPDGSCAPKNRFLYDLLVTPGLSEEIRHDPTQGTFEKKGGTISGSVSPSLPENSARGRF